MGDPKPSGDGLDPLDRRFREIEKQLRALRSPSGTQKVTGVDQIIANVEYQASLKTYGATGSFTSTGTVTNDGIVHWYNTATLVRVIAEIPTGKCLVTASLGEASMTPGGSFVVGYVSYRIRDVNGVVVNGAFIGANSGRLYTSTRMGISISTGPQAHTIDTVANPGPYEVTLFVGMWVAVANTTPCSALFNDPSLVVQVIGDGINV